MNGDFTAGVVEGFYGVPWTADQRKTLFNWMQKMDLNTYMYAPKDDCKHRAFWRELYSVEEADSLTSLIESAGEKGVTFVYAISPGLDISFSNAKDVQALKRKLEQVAAFGCQAFAILFDDIDPELSEADQSVFSSSACAQASITNEIYEHLRQPKFLFCPTEYCATRALPTVLTSDYLKTLGSKLLPGIDIMWTGCMVVSKKITIQTLEDITAMLKRSPVIWDNIHANDYDPRRVFLGPYAGRSSEIIPYLRGVMTNPNCEFEANYIACHTLGQWCKSNPDGVKKDIISGGKLSSVSADIKLETESDFSSDDDLPAWDCHYRPHQALKTAMNEWLTELTASRDPPKRTLPVSAIANTPFALPVFPAEDSGATVLPAPSVDLSVELSPVLNPSFLQPEALAQPINSLVEEPVSEVSDAASDSSCDIEPMDGVQPSNTVPVLSNLNVVKAEHSVLSTNTVDLLDEQMLLEDSCKDCIQAQTVNTVLTSGLLTAQDVTLMVDLFYTPFEHGTSSLQLLHSLHWLLTNAHCIHGNCDAAKASEWRQHLEEFEKKVQAVDVLLTHLFMGPNKSVLYDLYAYLWDMHGVLGICLAYVKWLEMGVVSNTAALTATEYATWFSQGYREIFTSGDQEPWVFRGGLQAELQRLLPICATHDLFLIKTPDWVIQALYRNRPYKQEDQTSVYDICLKTCDDGMDGSEAFSEFPHLLGDRLVGSFLAFSPEFCFVVEGEHSMCGYAMAALDAQDLATKSNQAWVPAMQDKYSRPAQENLSPAEKIMLSFHTESLEVREDVYLSYPSVVRMDVMFSRVYDPAVPQRLLASALCAIKAAGSKGVHTKLNSGDKFMVDFYTKLGFVLIPAPAAADQTSEFVYMGRLI
ncbi:protein O-GlcNAcase-like [Littorina saxatilis]|uniref:protein O-GlcNAcase n=1 Tax=Littorina saxatilis TaxID=31220 RepID=A0AAN9GIU4_9CAEN